MPHYLVANRYEAITCPNYMYVVQIIHTHETVMIMQIYNMIFRWPNCKSILDNTDVSGRRLPILDIHFKTSFYLFDPIHPNAFAQFPWLELIILLKSGCKPCQIWNMNLNSVIQSCKVKLCSNIFQAADNNLMSKILITQDLSTDYAGLPMECTPQHAATYNVNSHASLTGVVLHWNVTCDLDLFYWHIS